MKIAILGAGGCFGQNTAQHFMDAGHERSRVGSENRLARGLEWHGALGEG